MSKEQTPTPHNSARYEDIAETVIMAGDPNRVKYIVDNYVDNPVLCNKVRGALGYTGTYKGKRVTVQAHGMGIPSISIYAHELFNFYDVKQIIRVGTCGTLDPQDKLGKVVIAQGACTDSNYDSHFHIPGKYAPIADFQLLEKAAGIARAHGIDYYVGNVLSSDAFYGDMEQQSTWSKFGVNYVEMEASALYLNAVMAKKKALVILSVSDNIVTGEALTPDQRAVGLKNMIELALDLI